MARTIRVVILSHYLAREAPLSHPHFDDKIGWDTHTQFYLPISAPGFFNKTKACMKSSLKLMTNNCFLCLLNIFV